MVGRWWKLQNYSLISKKQELLKVLKMPENNVEEITDLNLIIKIHENVLKKLFQNTTQDKNGELNSFLNEVLVPQITKFFLNLEKARAIKSTIKIPENNCEEIAVQKLIIWEFQYTSKHD